MKKIILLKLLILNLLIISCSNLSKEEKDAQKYIEKVINNTNKMLNLPTKVDQFAYAEKVKFDKKKNIIIYSYVIDTKKYGSEFNYDKVFNKIKYQQYKNAIENQGKDPNYEILRVTIKSIYKNKNNDTLYSFSIKPEDYLRVELLKKEKLKQKKALELFSNQTFNVEFKNGIIYDFVQEKDLTSNVLEEKYKKVGKSSTLILETNIGNPFNEKIELTDVVVELIIKYKVGKFIIKSKKYRDYLFEKNKLSDFDVLDFFNNDEIKLKRLQRYSYYLELTRDAWSNTNHNDEEDVKRLEEAKKFYKEIMFKYSKKNLIKLNNDIKKFEKYFDTNPNYKYLTDIQHQKYYPDFLNNKSTYCFRLFKDFEKTENSDNLNNLPSLNYFKAEKVILNIYLTAKNSNGFYFSNKIKTIDITNKWNNHFVKIQ